MMTYASRRMLLLCLALLAAGCVSTKLTGVWVDSARSGPPVRNVLVIGVTNDIGIRQQFERSFVAGFESRGVRATASSAIMSPDKKLERAEVEEAIEGRGFDTVLVTRLLGVDTEVRETPGAAYVVADTYYGRGFYPYYTGIYTVVAVPGYLESYDTVRLETSLWDVAEGKVFWSAQSETFDPASVTQVIETLREAIFRRLGRDGILGG